MGMGAMQQQCSPRTGQSQSRKRAYSTIALCHVFKRTLMQRTAISLCVEIVRCCVTPCDMIFHYSITINRAFQPLRLQSIIPCLPCENIATALGCAIHNHCWVLRWIWLPSPSGHKGLVLLGSCSGCPSVCRSVSSRSA
jgi:hypothetical protein